ncbi:HAD family hydrolase [Pseudomonas sp. ICMP 10191]|uniref:HAD family hydrolase n=1 Tax=Pseudomonas sp. ICMP 10191 TaxID=1198294 RepID=UPI001F195E97|nr:HAD hydrolase-like protein [Pseudomonas sp. ICMP 10191]
MIDNPQNVTRIVMKNLLITDVDNTLFDWQHMWYKSFLAMSMKAIDISGIDPNRYYEECKILHQKHGTSEYSFVLSELPSLKKMYGDNVRDIMQPAIQEFRDSQNSTLVLYPGVRDTLKSLKKEGVTIAAFTESKAFYTHTRFKKLGLDEIVDFIYSPKDHVLPDDRNPTAGLLTHTEHRYTPEGEMKPNPHILLSIIEELSFKPNDTLYVGDNLFKDVFMAQQAGVTDVYASYGAAQHRTEEYDLLKKVTHWTNDMIEKEKKALHPGAITPTHSATKSFNEILKLMRL